MPISSPVHAHVPTDINPQINEGSTYSAIHEINSQLINCTGLKIAHINVCSLYPKIDEIRFCMKTLQIDVLCISETWLHAQLGDKEVSVEGYDIIRKDRTNKRGGGVCVYVKSSLTIINRNDTISQYDIETILLEFKCKENNFLVCCVYRPPNSGPDFFEIFTEMLETIIMNDNDLIILGDFNINYSIGDNTPIHSLECLFSLHQLINKPTRVTASSSTCIDLILTTMPDNHVISDVGQIALSDHYMIFTCVNCNVSNLGHKMARFRDYRDLNSDKFIEDICNCDILTKDLDFSLETSSDDIWLDWVNAFLEICNKHAPIKNIRVKKNRYSPWMTPDIIALINKRDYLKRKAKCDTTFNEYRKQRNDVTSAIRKAKTDYLNSVSENFRNNPKKLWGELHKVTGNSKYVNGVQSDIGPDEINDFFINIGQQISNSFIKEPLRWKNPKCLYEFKFTEVLEEDVLKFLRQLSINSNLDIIDIDCKLLNIASTHISRSLTTIFNFSLKTGFVFDDWKYARVTPVYKGKGDKEVFSNYRPISVVSHLAKIQEKLVQTQFISYLLRHDLITVEQSAFLKDHSTVTCLHRVIDDWLEALNDREVVAVCFLDISKCFDAISHELLLLKLQYFGVHGTELRWFESYLSGRKQAVSLNGKLSKPGQVSIVIPQGGVLGPVLFLLFINDITQSVNAGTCNIFADDVAIYTSCKTVEDAESQLQICINEIDRWYKNNRLKINADKTNVMVISSRAKGIHKELNVKLNDTKLKQVNSVRYLGVNIDCKLTWDEHVKQLCKNVAYKIFSLRRLSSSLNTSLLNTLYKGTIQPCIDYACSVWGNCSQKNENS